jgi:branched-chain amino acid aminotransferase
MASRTAPDIFVGDRWVPREKAVVSVFDHGVLYADGIYEGMRSYGGRIFRAAEHYARLERSARCIGLALPYDVGQIASIVREGLATNDLEDAYIRLVVTRGPGPIGPDPRPCKDPQLIVIVQDTPPLHGAGREGIAMGLSTIRRAAVDSATAQIKSLNYLTSIMAKNEAARLGVDDMAMLDSRGFVAEAPVANIFVVRDGCVATPGGASAILEGVTRQAVIEILRGQGVPVREGDVTPYDLSVADEVFLTGTHAEIVPVTRYNGMEVGGGRIGDRTRLALDGFRAATREAPREP